MHAVAGQVGKARGRPDGGGGALFERDPGTEALATDVFAVAPGAGLALEQVGQRVAVHVDPGAALGGRVERGPSGEVEALQGVAWGRVRGA